MSFFFFFFFFFIVESLRRMSAIFVWLNPSSALRAVHSFHKFGCVDVTDERKALWNPSTELFDLLQVV